MDYYIKKMVKMIINFMDFDLFVELLLIMMYFVDYLYLIDLIV